MNDVCINIDFDYIARCGSSEWTPICDGCEARISFFSRLLLSTMERTVEGLLEVYSESGKDRLEIPFGAYLIVSSCTTGDDPVRLGTVNRVGLDGSDVLGKLLGYIPIPVAGIGTVLSMGRYLERVMEKEMGLLVLRWGLMNRGEEELKADMLAWSSPKESNS